MKSLIVIIMALVVGCNYALAQDDEYDLSTNSSLGPCCDSNGKILEKHDFQAQV